MHMKSLGISQDPLSGDSCGREGKILACLSPSGTRSHTHRYQRWRILQWQTSSALEAALDIIVSMRLLEAMDLAIAEGR